MQHTGKPAANDKVLRLLCVEDNARDVKLLVEILRRAGYQLDLDTVDDSASYRERLTQGDYDVIVCDFNLNDWTAIEALEILRTLGKDIPVIVVSGSLGDEAAADCIKQGATDYVLKDRMARLPTAIQRALEAKEARGEQRKAALALSKSEEEYRLLFDGNPNPMWVFDAETLAFLAVNDAAVRHYGYSREEFLRMTAGDIRPVEEVARFMASLEALGSEAAPMGASGIFKHRKKDGTIIEIEGAATVIQFRDRTARLVLVNDVTEKNSLQAQLLQAQKMESVGLLAGGIAHDFSNLLNIVVGYTEMLQGRISDRPELRHYTEDVLQAARRAADLTRQLLAFGRRQILRPEVLNLNSLIEEFENMVHRIISENIEIRTSIKSQHSLVRADAGQIEQVLLNLVINARDAMARGGCLTIETDDVNLDDDFVRRHHTMKAGPHIMLAVSDTGHGMPPEVLARIFEPFFTTKEPGKGTGLGLGVVYGIVKQCGGWIWAYSEPGRGSTFKVYLPSVDADAGVALPKHPVSEMPRGNATILLVEDEAGLRNMMYELLTGLGYTVLLAQHGAEALRIVESHKQPINLLITDLVMPGMGGRELAERLTELRPSLLVLYLSGYTEDSVVLEGIRSNEVPFLQKPVTGTDLAHKVDELLRRSALADRPDEG